MASEIITYDQLLKERNRQKQLKIPKAVEESTDIVLLPAFLYGVVDHVDPYKYEQYHKWTRWKIFKAKGFSCIYCGITGTHAVLWSEYNWTTEKEQPHCDLIHIAEDGKRILLTLDHFVPKSKEGSNMFDNLFPCCHICNKVKADKILVDFSLPK